MNTLVTIIVIMVAVLLLQRQAAAAPMYMHLSQDVQQSLDINEPEMSTGDATDLSSGQAAAHETGRDSEHGISADAALARLKAGNREYLTADTNPGDCSFERRFSLAGGQKPFAVVVACSDSRVVPEAIFSVGLGEIFVIRVAGNVLGDHELGSVEYAVGHLGANLVVVLGHECCGAIGAALEGHSSGYVKTLVDAIKPGIGNTKDPKAASMANAAYVAREMRAMLDLPADSGVKIVSAYYHLSGKVDFVE